MDQTLLLHAETREVSGRQVKALRHQGKVPAVLYGHNVSPKLLTLSRGELERIYRKAGGSSVVKVALEAGQQNVLIQEVQHDPRTGRFLHADLYQVRMDEKIKADVPIEFTGTAPAVRELEGTLLTNLSELEVECLPGDLPHEIIVDISKLETFEDAITVADIKVPAVVTILNDAETNVASVTPPRTQEELDELEEAPEELDAEAVEEVGKEGEEGEEGEAAEAAEAEEGKEGKGEAKPEAADQGKDDKGDKGGQGEKPAKGDK